MKNVLVLEKEPDIVRRLNEVTEYCHCIYRSDNFYQARLNSDNDIIVVAIPILTNNLETIEDMSKKSKVILISLYANMVFRDINIIITSKNRAIQIVLDYLNKQ